MIWNIQSFVRARLFHPEEVQVICIQLDINLYAIRANVTNQPGPSCLKKHKSGLTLSSTQISDLNNFI